MYMNKRKAIAMYWVKAVLYASERTLEELEGDVKVLDEEWDDIGALVYTDFTLRFDEQHKEFCSLELESFGEFQESWSTCFEEVQRWQLVLRRTRLVQQMVLKGTLL